MIRNMKHLKKFNESTNWNDIKDICIELEDIGMTVEIDDYGVEIFAEDKIIWEDVKDCLLRLKDYLGEDYLFFEYKLGRVSDGRWDNKQWEWIRIELNEKTYISTNVPDFNSICRLYIEYKKIKNYK